MWCCGNIVYVITNTYAYVLITYMNYAYEQVCYTIIYICDIFSHYWKYEKTKKLFIIKYHCIIIWNNIIYVINYTYALIRIICVIDISWKQL